MDGHLAVFLGPTSLVSANRRVTLLGPPNRWCTNSKAPAVQIESLRIWSTSPTVDISKPKGESLEVLPEMQGPKLPNLWPRCGDVTKETSFHKFKNHFKKRPLHDTWKTKWNVSGLVSLDPSPAFRSRKCLQFRYTVDLSLSIFRGQIQLRYLTAYLRFWVKNNLLPISRFVDFFVRQVLTTITKDAKGLPVLHNT